MTTKLIGIKEFRQNISDFTNRARKGDVRFIITNRNKPLFELKPFSEEDGLEKIFSDIVKAEDDITKGKMYTQEEMLAELS